LPFLGKANRERTPLPSFFTTLHRYARRRIVYTIFGLNVLLTYAQEQFDQTSLWWNVTLLSYTTKYYTGVESMQGIYCVFPPHFPQNVDNRLIE
jgi:hypothetical protein